MTNNETSFYLKKVTLDGYKSIKNLDLDLKPGLNIIIGKNASGKTNFLTFLNKALGLSYDNLINFSSALEFIGVNEFRIKASNQFNEESFANRSIESLSIQPDMILEDRNNSSQTYHTSSELKKEIEKRKISYSSIFIQHGVPENYPIVSTPLSFEIEKKGLSKQLLNHILAPKGTKFFKGFLGHVFMSIFHLSSENNLTDQTLQKVLEDSILILNEVADKLKKYSPIEAIRVSDSYSIKDGEDKDVFYVNNLVFEYKIKGTWLSFDNLSDGTKRLFYVISDLVFNPNHLGLENIADDHESKIVLIEEPELGVHPHQLMDLMKLIKEESANQQIILTTHSPIVLDELNSNELDGILITDFIDGRTVFRRLNEAELKKAKMYIDEGLYLSDYWKHSNLEVQ